MAWILNSHTAYALCLKSSKMQTISCVTNAEHFLHSVVTILPKIDNGHNFSMSKTCF